MSAPGISTQDCGKGNKTKVNIQKVNAEVGLLDLPDCEHCHHILHPVEAVRQLHPYKHAAFHVPEEGVMSAKKRRVVSVPLSRHLTGNKNKYISHTADISNTYTTEEYIP